MQMYAVAGDNLLNKQLLLSSIDWVQIAWPNWAQRRQAIVFEGLPTAGAGARGIYSLAFADSSPSPEVGFLTAGRLPALSPDGELLATVDQGDHLEISQLNDGMRILMRGPKVSSTRPVVWIGNESIVFLAENRQVQRLSLPSGAIETTGFNEFVPVAAIDDTGNVLCVDYSGHEISVIDLSHGTSRVIKKYFATSIGIGLTWDGSRRAVFLSRQTWSKLFRLNDSRDLFLLEMDGSDRRLMPDLTIFGGFSLR